jgi:hypothetical protein
MYLTRSHIYIHCYKAPLIKNRAPVDRNKLWSSPSWKKTPKWPTNTWECAPRHQWWKRCTQNHGDIPSHTHQAGQNEKRHNAECCWGRGPVGTHALCESSLLHPLWKSVALTTELRMGSLWTLWHCLSALEKSSPWVLGRCSRISTAAPQVSFRAQGTNEVWCVCSMEQ